MSSLIDSSFDNTCNDGVWIVIHRGNEIPFWLRSEYSGFYKFSDSVVGCFASRKIADAWCRDHPDFYYVFCGFFKL